MRGVSGVRGVCGTVGTVRVAGGGDEDGGFVGGDGGDEPTNRAYPFYTSTRGGNSALGGES
jgi:hypothetical protein